MPSKKQYDLVQNDDYDTRIPLHPEEAFHHGIIFQAKFIGMLDVPRPTSRVEIVAAMRRIRYEFKAKGIKKKKVTLEVSIDGVKVTLRKKKKRRHWDDKNIILQHPIYRIFYVSHDSQDLKIFSYIARDGASNVFKCAVFKSNKKSQAMRVVRTIGQAFEVCHKLSINGPEQDNLDQDEQETLTQDLLSDRFSDAASDKPKKDLISEVASDKISLPPDDSSVKDSYLENSKHRLPQLDILPPPPTNNLKKTQSMHAETYVAPHSDIYGGGSTGSGSGSLPPPGSALSAHHELQLMREQLEQQNQQTQAAIAQLQLAREQLAAEQTARLEAQARTHQLLVHNRELLDHIAALVAHLQGGDKQGQQATPPHLTMPQQLQHPPPGDSSYKADNQDNHNYILQALGLIENRSVGSCLPQSPLRNTFNPGGGVFNFAYPPQTELSFESQLLQRLQSMQNLTGYQQYPYLSQGLYNPVLMNNNTYPVSSPTQNTYAATPYATLPRYSSNLENRLQTARHSEPRQIPTSMSQEHVPNINNTKTTTHLQVSQDSRQQRGASPKPQSTQEENREVHYIKPLPQMGTLTTTDSEGRVRVIVPVPSNSVEEADDVLSNLRISDDLRLLNGPGITRSTSERVPNRSELMMQVERTAWARHTTK